MSKILVFTALVFPNLVRTTQAGGYLNSVGILCPYLASYFHSIDPQIHSSDVLTITTFAYLFEVVFGPAMSFLTFYVAEYRILIAGVIFGPLLYFFCTFITNAYLFFVVFGLNLGVLSGVFGFLPAWIAFRYLGESNKGLVMGISSATYAFGPFVYGTLFSLISNPINEPATALDGGEVMFSSAIYENVPDAGRWVAVIIAITCTFSAIIFYSVGKTISDKKEEKKLYPMELIKQSTFWYLFCFMFFRTFYYYFLLNCYKMIGLYYLKNEYDLSMISTIAFIFATFFRIIGGKLYDKHDWTKLNVLFILIEVLFNLTMPLVVENLYLYGIWIACSLPISGLSYMGVWILTERTYSNASWVITYVALATVLDMLAINMFFRFIISVFLT
jgi:MFS family permease